MNDIIEAAGGTIVLDKQAVRDGNLITGKAAGSSTAFALELIAAMRDNETAEQVRHAIIG